MHSLNKSDFDQCNIKIIKLLRQKIYPFQYQQRKRQLPTIKYGSHNNSIHKLNKKYVEIQIEKGDEQNMLSQETDLQQQLQFNVYQDGISIRATGKYQGKPNSQSLHQLICKGRQRLTTNNEVESENQCHLAHKQKYLLKQYDNNKNYLQIFKSTINQKKREYLKQIKLSQFISNPYEKDKYSFQYLVNQMETNQIAEKVINKKSLPYENISPNHLSEYLKILSPNKISNYGEISSQERINSNKGEKQLTRIGKRKGTVILQLSNPSTQGLSAKLRLKANHKKMIELIKN